jgi:formiminotetrahydrofolate cyclodeaminase
MFEKMNLDDFVKQVASNEPVPGGGSVSALAGSLAAALSNMVASLTIGKKKYLEVEEDMKKVKEEAIILQEDLISDITRDSEAFNRVMKAFKMPKNSDEEKAERKEAIQNGSKHASEVPLNVAEKSLKIMDLAKIVVEKGNKNAITDGAVSAMLARTAGLGALYNVKINLSSIKDEEYVSKMNEKVTEIENALIQKEKEILDLVKL